MCIRSYHSGPMGWLLRSESRLPRPVAIWGILNFRITDISGEQYHFKEASLALSRILRKRKEEFDIWHPADCIGEVGAAMGPVMIAVLKAASEKRYAKGARMLVHLGNDDGKRSAMVFSWQAVGSH